jgi:hypothetical protein
MQPIEAVPPAAKEDPYGALIKALGGIGSGGGGGYTAKETDLSGPKQEAANMGALLGGLQRAAYERQINPEASSEEARLQELLDKNKRTPTQLSRGDAIDAFVTKFLKGGGGVKGGLGAVGAVAEATDAEAKRKQERRAEDILLGKELISAGGRDLLSRNKVYGAENARQMGLATADSQELQALMKFLPLEVQAKIQGTADTNKARGSAADNAARAALSDNALKKTLMIEKFKVDNKLNSPFKYEKDAAESARGLGTTLLRTYITDTGELNRQQMLFERALQTMPPGQALGLLQDTINKIAQPRN